MCSGLKTLNKGPCYYKKLTGGSRCSNCNDVYYNALEKNKKREQLKLEREKKNLTKCLNELKYEYVITWEKEYEHLQKIANKSNIKPHELYDRLKKLNINLSDLDCDVVYNFNNFCYNSDPYQSNYTRDNVEWRNEQEYRKKLEKEERANRMSESNWNDYKFFEDLYKY